MGYLAFALSYDWTKVNLAEEVGADVIMVVSILV
jgi:hypothetical protein